jgi:hypothetical protein
VVVCSYSFFHTGHSDAVINLCTVRFQNGFRYLQQLRAFSISIYIYIYIYISHL